MLVEIRLPYRLRYGRHPLFNAKARVIQIDIEASQIVLLAEYFDDSEGENGRIN